MAKVYVSSTLQDLVAERKAAFDWLITAGHQPLDSYRPDGKTVRESCLEDVAGCDIYVLIQGHRYGFQPADGNPENLSITHLEFRRARSIPRVALLRQSVPNVALSDLGDPERSRLVLAFIEEVRAAVRASEFFDTAGLIQGLSTGVQTSLDSSDSRAELRDRQVTEIVATLTEELRRKNQQIDAGTAEAAALRVRVAELEEQLRAAVARTLAAADGPSPAPGAGAAAAALRNGSTGPAEALLADQERREASTIGRPGVDDAEYRRRAAQLAREQGVLAISNDVRAALLSFERAATYSPDDAWAQFFIGDINLQIGQVSLAFAAYNRARASVADVAARHPASRQWQRDLSVCHNRLGDVLRARGDASGATASYRAALAIAERFAVEAEAAYRVGLAIVERLIERSPLNMEWLSSLALSYERLGSVLEARGDRARAAAALRAGLLIRERLAAPELADTLRKPDLSVMDFRTEDLQPSRPDERDARVAGEGDERFAHRATPTTTVQTPIEARSTRSRATRKRAKS
jgi:tetratricopeptide (TPR) repeat protein